MGYNRYRGNTGRVEYVDLPDGAPAPPVPASRARSAALLPAGLPAGLGNALSQAFLGNLETEDLLVAAILYLAYRSTGDTELLIALGAYLFL